MRELETLEQFGHWLTEQGKRPATIAKYCACLSACRAENPRCLHAWAADQGLCLPEKTLAELSIPELYRIAWQGRDTLAPLSRSALAALMEFRLSLEPALPRMDRMAGPQLDDVRRALQSAYVEEGGEPECWRTAGAYRALAQLLLQAPGYEMARKDQWERELCPGGKPYPLNRRVMLWNLEHLAGMVETEIGARLTGLLELTGETERVQCQVLRRFLSAAARRLKQIWQDRPGFSGSRSEQLLLRMAGWDTAGTGAGPDSGWYGALPPGEMRVHMTDLSRQLLHMCVEYGGRGFPPVCPVRPETEETVRLCRLLAPFDRLLEPGDWEQVRRDCGDRALERGQIAACLVQGLLRVEVLPRRGGGVLALAGPLEETFRPDGERELLSAMAELWTDAHLRPILLALIHRLAERWALLEQTAEDWPEQSGALLSHEPELTALLAAASAESPAEGGSRRDRLLDRLALETAGVEDPQLLLERFQALIARRPPGEEDLESARQLTGVLVRCHWTRSRGRPTPAGAESLLRLLALYRRRPAAVLQALKLDLEESERGLFPAVLLGWTARLVLALTEEETRPCGERMFYANWVRNAAGEGSGTARRLGLGPLAFDLGLLRCRATVLHVELEAERAAAVELLADHIVPCAEELLRCRETLSEGEFDAEARWAETALRCAAAFFSEGTPVRRRLEESALWSDLPRRMDTEEALRALTDREPAPGPAGSGSLFLTPSHILERGPRHWYCAYLDSETSVRKGYSQERMESYMLKTLWSAQDIVLTANQAADNRVIRALAYEPGFQMLLRWR